MTKETQKLDFSAINKTTAKSFNEQKNLIKRLFKGNTVLCETCKQPLKLVVPTDIKQTGKYGVFCKKGCTDIELEIEMVL
ncbi:hypothetical protein FM038_016540 [Shewanella eurypsychrophilus]|uniref:MYM-type domain-containing protein n=1 Tax=Shewanella eurypsychrophilus TaxID=2593656 RepID=A0ABX6VBC9_9GAMM|nr:MULTISPECIES: hypothetical protein [Shewanella]QFU23623.1 hypothetical protein FS418_18340 [Shewanella sp. YLB-09]QPG58846.1 hypothetical protein FM038_016540 [Shewanella eurypsychrophilus]